MWTPNSTFWYFPSQLQFIFVQEFSNPSNNWLNSKRRAYNFVSF